eukprot:scaffold123923_cov32-Tisochrysis_lutea.AAC.5
MGVVMWWRGTVRLTRSQRLGLAERAAPARRLDVGMLSLAERAAPARRLDVYFGGDEHAPHLQIASGGPTACQFASRLRAPRPVTPRRVVERMRHKRAKHASTWSHQSNERVPKASAAPAPGLAGRSLQELTSGVPPGQEMDSSVGVRFSVG